MSGRRLAAAAAPPPAPAPPPSPMLGVRRQRQLPEQPPATSRAGPLSASLRAASALPPQSGHGLRGPRTAPDCRRPGYRGREQARRRGGPEGEGNRGRGRPRALRAPNGGGEGLQSQINSTASCTTSRPDPTARRPIIGPEAARGAANGRPLLSRSSRRAAER